MEEILNKHFVKKGLCWLYNNNRIYYASNRQGGFALSILSSFKTYDSSHWFDNHESKLYFTLRIL